MTESPEGSPSFVETESFTESWGQLGLGDDDLRAVQNAILERPQGFPVIPGTGGLRKIRYSPLAWSKGKRGSLRICFVLFAEHNLVMPGPGLLQKGARHPFAF